MNVHGHIVCCWHGDLLTVDAIGPFNSEGIIAASDQLKQSIESANQVSWLRLDLPNNDALGDPAVMVRFGQSYLWGFNRGCRAMALVYANLLQRSLCEAFVNATNVNLQVFDNKNDALEWLTTQ